MTRTERLWEQFVLFHADARDTMGAFLFEPFGIESSDVMNALALYAGIGIGLMIIFQLSRPVHRARARHSVNEYDFGRNV